MTDLTPGTEDLRPWGYAPGFYTARCIDCPPELTIQQRGMADKRAWRCEEHARAAKARPPVAPEAQGMVEELRSMQVWLSDTKYSRPLARIEAIITAQASQLEEARQALHDAKAAMEYWAGCDAGCTPDEASSEIMSSGGAWPSVSYDKVCATLARIAPGIAQEIGEHMKGEG